MADVTRISPAQAKQLVDEGWVYLDVRTEPEFAAGHPEGAHNVPVAIPGPRGLALNADFLPLVQALYPPDTPLVLGCRSGVRSMRAARMLLAAGYTRVAEQRAGFDGARDPFGQVLEQGWAAAGLPIGTGSPAASYAALRAKAGRP